MHYDRSLCYLAQACSYAQVIHFYPFSHGRHVINIVFSALNLHLWEIKINNYGFLLSFGIHEIGEILA